MGRTWKYIKGSFDYKISSDGIVKRLLKEVELNIKGKTVTRVMPEKILKQYISTSGYLCVNINGNSKYLHRLLSEVFISNPNNKKTVNHKDGNKLNNSLENLEWATHKENNDHAKRMGLNKEVGETHHNAKLKTNDVENIKMMLNLGYKQSQLAREFNIDASVISDIKRGVMWNHVNI